MKLQGTQSRLPTATAIALMLALQACSSPTVPTTGTAPVTETTPKTDTVAVLSNYEAESTANLTGLTVREEPIASGGKVASNIGMGSSLELRIGAATAGLYKLTIYYLNGDNKPRSADLTVNDLKQKTLEFGNQGTWANPVLGSVETTVTLQAGRNLVRFSNPSGWTADIDRIAVDQATDLQPSPQPAPQPAPAPAPSEPASRDPWLWPFAQTSIWNMPIGSEAQYVPAGLGQADEVIVDTNLLFKVPAGAPERKVYRSAEWIDRCNPNTRLEQFAWSKRKTMPISDDLIVPDANSNNASAFLLPDGRTLVQVNPLARCQAGGPAYGEFSPDVDIYGPGIEGGHGGSGMSSIGGTLRKGELTGTGPIRHALKITIQASRYVAPKHDGTDGYRWPALRADGYAFDGSSHAYGGKVPELELGALLALRPEVSAESLGVRTEVGRKLVQALQDYGAYVVDDAYCHCHNITAEPGVELELNQKYGYGLGTENGPIMQDINRIWPALQVINNNTPDRIGGGGAPRRPLAPPFSH